jgi:DnaJ-class molecular chaperone
MDADALRQWLATLDSISYYQLFNLTPEATYDDLRNGFHAFAESFHPDGHQWRHPNEQAAISYIFKRGTEAYRVLSDPQLRPRYDQALANGILRPESLIVDAEGPRTQSGTARAAGIGIGTRLSDKVRNPGARPFVLRVEELAKKGDPQQAKLQLVMAMHMDRGNAALEAYGKELDELIKAKTDEAKKNWKK